LILISTQEKIFRPYPCLRPRAGIETIRKPAAKGYLLPELLLHILFLRLSLIREKQRPEQKVKPEERSVALLFVEVAHNQPIGKAVILMLAPM
jgi:hypothetical protein